MSWRPGTVIHNPCAQFLPAASRALGLQSETLPKDMSCLLLGINGRSDGPMITPLVPFLGVLGKVGLERPAPWEIHIFWMFGNFQGSRTSGIVAFDLVKLHVLLEWYI